MGQQDDIRRFWIIKDHEDGFYYLYDWFGMQVLRPPQYPQGSDPDSLIPHLEKLRRKHGEKPGAPYSVAMRRRPVDADEVDLD